MTQSTIVVAIPARNEADRIGKCLAALATQPSAAQRIAAVVVFANNCTDATAAIARSMRWPFVVIVVEADLPSECAHIGYARRGANDAAMAFAQRQGLADAIIACTDADSCVGPDWLDALLTAFGSGVDAVCGVIELDAAIPPALAAGRAAEARYAERVAQAASLLDPIAHDPWPNHIWSWGANFAIRARTLAAVGGTPLVDLAEDRALHALLLRHDARICHSLDVRVVTSARADGRAPGGFADLMSSYAADPAALADFALEPAAAAWRRALLRGSARRSWGDRPGFGAYWAERELASPRLARDRVTLAQLPGETAALTNWIKAVEGRSDTRLRDVARPDAPRAGWH